MENTFMTFNVKMEWSSLFLLFKLLFRLSSQSNRKHKPDQPANGTREGDTGAERELPLPSRAHITDWLKSLSSTTI